MPIINKTKNTAAIFNRGREVVKVYDHGSLAWQKSTSIPDYLCFTALEAGQFTLTIPAAVTPTYLSYVEWSKDGRTWTHTDNTSEAVTIDVQVAQGDKVYWRGSGTKCATSASTANASVFLSSIEFRVEGNPMSLLIGSRADAAANPTASYSFAYLFSGCPKLNHVKCLFTDISATNCLQNWLSGASSTGTFIQAEGVTWPRGASGIPTGWLAYDEGEEIPNDYAACDYIHITRGSGMVADVLADKSTYGCELEYNFTQNELDAAANNNTYIPLMYYSKAVTTDPDFPKQICGQLYLRYNANWLGWQRNAGIYTRPTTGEKTTNSSATIVKRPAVTGWHYIRCAATTTDDNFICLFDDESSQTGINYYRLMNENPTDEPAEIYISCRNNATTYPIDNGGDMKYFKIIHPDGETIVADYVPCVRKSDNVAGFWDKVRLVFKSSFGTPFVAGYNQT